jgi:hypothetical protein
MVLVSGKVLNSADIYLPAYMRLKVKNIIKVDTEDLGSTINAVIIFTVYYGKLHRNIVEALKDKFVLQFNRD